jgi:hypothetical protein
MSKTFQSLAKLFFGLPKLKDITAPFKLIETEKAKAIAEECAFMKESFWTEFTIRAHSKAYTITEVPVTHRNRLGGSTRVYKPSKIAKIVLTQLKGLLYLRRTLLVKN